MELQQLISRYQLAINTIYRGINNILKEEIQHDITPDQFIVLQHIHQNKTCTSTQIAKHFSVGKSAVTALVTRLFDKGFIERIRDKEDRRIVYLTLKEAGTELVEQTEKELYQVIREKLGHFNNSEIEGYIKALEKLASLMSNNKEHSQKNKP